MEARISWGPESGVRLCVYPNAPEAPLWRDGEAVCLDGFSDVLGCVGVLCGGFGCGSVREEPGVGAGVDEQAAGGCREGGGEAGEVVVVG